MPSNGSTIAASGHVPVATAMKHFCAQQGCGFAVMLGIVKRFHRARLAVKPGLSPLGGQAAGRHGDGRDAG